MSCRKVGTEQIFVLLLHPLWMLPPKSLGLGSDASRLWEPETCSRIVQTADLR